MKNLPIPLLLLITVFSFCFSQTAFAQATSTPQIATSTPPLPPNFDRYNSEDIKARVVAYFSDLPVMVAIADCESEFRQYDYDTTLLRGGGGTMVGIFQISESVHKSTAETKGLDISTIDGNIAYARYLYEEDGIYPWMSSFQCWNAKVKTSSATSTPIQNVSNANSLLTKDLQLGSVSPEVLVLQQLLNRNGFILALDGPGSPGNETTIYGIRTRNAVRSFQCAKQNICKGDELSTGYGFVNQETRTAILALSNSATPSGTVATLTAEEKVKLIKELQVKIALLTEQIRLLIEQQKVKVQN